MAELSFLEGFLHFLRKKRNCSGTKLLCRESRKKESADEEGILSPEKLEIMPASLYVQV